MIRVLIADDQALVRGGFHSILAGQDDIEVVGEAEDGNQAVELVAPGRELRLIGAQDGARVVAGAPHGEQVLDGLLVLGLGTLLWQTSPAERG